MASLKSDAKEFCGFKLEEEVHLISLGHYNLNKKVSNVRHHTNTWECEDKLLTEVKIGEKSQESNQELQDRKANPTKTATEFYSTPSPLLSMT